ncbi:MAG: hypothetical protein GF398_17705 [Chitinivibrionales bacterium]|nr:hypothetical protein [Chitinivibrionales bacterium]
MFTPTIIRSITICLTLLLLMSVPSTLDAGRRIVKKPAKQTEKEAKADTITEVPKPVADESPIDPQKKIDKGDKDTSSPKQRRPQRKK